MRSNSYMLYSKKDQCQFATRLSVTSETIRQEFTQARVARTQIKMLIMQFLLLALDTKTIWTTGLLRTHGVTHGVIKDTSRFKEVRTCAELQSATLSLMT